MLNTKQFLEAIEGLESQGIAKEITIQALKETFETIVKKKHIEGLPDLMVRVDILPEEGLINIFNIKNIVEEVTDDALEISLEEARETLPEAQVGEEFLIKVEVENFTKADALKFKSILKQKIKEAEKVAILNMYADKIDEVISGEVEKVDPVLVNLGRTSVVLKDSEKIGDERFDVGQKIKVYLSGVGAAGENGITISRACTGFLKRLFEEEIHDVFDGTVVINDIAREAGERSKVSVSTKDINVDPVGACIGPGGSKIQKICSQLNKEKIDVIQYHIHKGIFVAECLKPAQVVGVHMNDDGSALAIVRNGDLRVAVGKRGVNVRLASKLAGTKIDVKEEAYALENNISFLTIDEMKKEEEAMIFEERRRVLLEQIAREEELRKQRAAEELLNPKPVVEEVEDDYEEDYEEYEEEVVVSESPVEEVKVVEEKVEEVKEEPVVEFKPVILQPKVSLADLEKQLEEEKKKKSSQGNTSKKKVEKQEEKEVKVTKETTRMEIYTQEELEAFDEEYEDEDYLDDEEIDYDDYDEYYDE